jgi:hypothetical protein
MTNSHQDQCSLCALGVDMEPELTNVALGQKYGVSEGSVRRHRKALRKSVEVTLAGLQTVRITR